MRATEAYGDLFDMGQSIVASSEAQARWKVSPGTAGYRLRALQDAGLVRRLRRGLWGVTKNIDPFAVAPYLTSPFPAYVSMWSALSRHDMIEQIPRYISVASLDRARQIETTVGIYEIHKLAPEVFGGFVGSESNGYLATPEKALFDTVYVRIAASSQVFFTELSLPADFDYPELKRWTTQIKAARLRTLVSRRLRALIKQASR